MSNIKKLLDMKEQIKSTELKKAQGEGKLSQSMKNLKDKGFDSLASAEKKINGLTKKSEKIEKRIIDGIEQLEEDYEWE